MLYKQGARCKIASRGSDAPTNVVMCPVHASKIPRTASFAWHVPDETASEYYIVIVLPNCIGGFVMLNHQPRFSPKRWYGEMSAVPDLIDATK